MSILVLQLLTKSRYLCCVNDNINWTIKCQEHMVDSREMINPRRPFLDISVFIHLKHLWLDIKYKSELFNFTKRKICWAFLTNIYLSSLKQVDGDPGRVAYDEDHHDGQQQHWHGSVTPMTGGSHHLRPGICLYFDLYFYKYQFHQYPMILKRQKILKVWKVEKELRKKSSQLPF